MTMQFLLQIKLAQLQDAGTYISQISVPRGTISRKVQFHVFHPGQARDFPEIQFLHMVTYDHERAVSVITYI